MNHRTWHEALTPREVMEVQFNIHYADKFGHGTDGHTIRLLVAHLAVLLDYQETEIQSLREELSKQYE